jgi:hypothetical protein
MRAGIVATTIVAACQFSHGVLPPDGNGSGSGEPDAGICTSLSSECIGDTLRVCTVVGSAPTDFPCGWGCVGGAAAHCAHVVPSGSGGSSSNGVMPSDVAGDGLSATTLGDGVFIDTDNGRIGTLASPNLHHGAQTGIENGIDFQMRGPISMFRFKSLTITGTVSLIGRRPVALVADGDITINGVLDARGGCTTFNPGPGGFNGGSAAGQSGSAPGGSMGGGSGATASSGGGGGAYGTAGGSAKDATGGMPFGNAEITVLVGGAGGGAGGGGGNFGRGGGGGGAVQLISNTNVVIASGGINAGGCGGKLGAGANDSGGGGGAGGTILIEAPAVSVAGALAVNGGGGGGGGGNNGTSGANATLDRTPATAGAGDAPDEDGGAGAAGATGPGSGEGGSNPGGGGGGLGRIRINTRNGAAPTLTGATLSPSPEDPSSTFSTGSAVAQ